MKTAPTFEKAGVDHMVENKLRKILSPYKTKLSAAEDKIQSKVKARWPATKMNEGGSLDYEWKKSLFDR